MRSIFLFSSFPWLTITTISFGFLFFILLNVNIAYSTPESSKTSHLNESYWTVGKNMSTARNELSAVVLNDKIYAIGGEDFPVGGGQKDTVEVYDIAKDNWVEDNVAPMPLPLDHSASAVYDGKIYVVGGFLKRKIPTDKLFIYDPRKNEWQEGRSLPSAVGGAKNAEFINGILYVVGGLNSSHIPLKTNYAYDPKFNNWTIKSPMPTARHHLQTAVFDGKLFALGGRILGDGIPSEDIDEAKSNFNRNEMYDPQTDSWTVRQPMLIKRSGFTASTSPDGNIYVFGGQGPRHEDLDNVEKYDPVADKWTYDKPMPTQRFGLESVVFGDKIYVLGGEFLHPNRVPLNINEIFHVGKEQKN
jgi:Kelch motif